MPKKSTEMTPRQKQEVFERIMRELAETGKITSAEAEKAIEERRNATDPNLH